MKYDVAKQGASRASERRVAKVGATSSPLPLAGEGQGGGMRAPNVVGAHSPPLPRKREREQAESVASIVVHLNG